MGSVLKKILIFVCVASLSACGGSSSGEVESKIETTPNPKTPPPTREIGSADFEDAFGSITGTTTSQNFVLESKSATEEKMAGENYILENE